MPFDAHVGMTVGFHLSALQQDVHASIYRKSTRNAAADSFGDGYKVDVTYRAYIQSKAIDFSQPLPDFGSLAGWASQGNVGLNVAPHLLPTVAVMLQVIVTSCKTAAALGALGHRTLGSRRPE